MSLCLVTGATGYIGGRLVPELLAAGHSVRVLTRNPDRLRDHPWRHEVEVAQGDAAIPTRFGQRSTVSTSRTTWCTHSAPAAPSRRPTGVPLRSSRRRPGTAASAG
jgi:NAD(P)-dependent dehydrogenase (short-subunit alcohol dehydrogenase family)